MRSTIVALVAIFLGAATPVFAGGGDKGSLELGIYGGFGWLDEYGIFHPDDDNIMGARLGYFFSRHISLEASLQRLNTDTEFDTLGLGETDVEFKLKSLRGNLIYNFGNPGGFRPFLTFGLGREKMDVEGFGKSSDLGWNAGGGFRIPLGSRF